MFGSNYDQVFGIPAFPNQGIDAQGGLFAANTGPAISSDLGGSHGMDQPPATPGLGSSPGLVKSAPDVAPATGVASGGTPGAGSPFALGSPLTGTSWPSPQQPAPAPAAGVGSPFGGPNV